MNDLSSLSDDELRRIAGYDSQSMDAVPMQNPMENNNPLDFSSISTEELQKIVNGKSGPSSLLEKGLALGKGFASGFGGGGIDTAALAYNAPAAIHNATVDMAKEKSPEELTRLGLGEYGIKGVDKVPYIPSAVEGIEHGIESIGIKTPEDARGLYEGAKLAGEVAGVGGIGKASIKYGLKGLGKAVGYLGSTKPTHLIGTGVAGKTMHDVGEKYGPGAGLVAGATTGALSTKAATKGAQFLKSLAIPRAPGESIKEMTLGKMLSIMGEPDQAIENYAKKEGLNLPFNMRLQGSTSNFIANVGLKTYFTAQAWKDQVKNTPKAILDTVINKINDVHPENLGRERSSAEARSFLKERFTGLKKDSKELYLLNEKDATPTDMASISPLGKSLIEVRNKYDVWSPSSDAKYVMRKVNELGQGLGIIPKKTKDLEDPVLFNKVVDALAKEDKKVPLQKLTRQKSEWMKDTDWNKEGGANEDMKMLTGKLEEAIETTTNKKFLASRKIAKGHFKDEIANIVRDDLSRALARKDMPILAYDYMSSPENVRNLQRIIGDSSQGTQLMNALKRSKLKDFLEDKISDNQGNVKFDTLATMFRKKNENQEMLRELLGNENYNKLKDISNVASSAAAAGKEFFNTSGSATVGSDILRAGGLMTVIASGGTGGGTLALSIGAPYIASKVLSNNRYMDAAVRYALEIRKGNPKLSSEYRRKMKDIFYDIMRKETPHQINKEIQEEE